MSKTQLPQAYYDQMLEIQEIDFVLVELTLYLDTHPDDLEALKQYNSFAKKRMEMKKQFEEQFGPLQQYGNSYSTYPWAWDATPWPWQV